jgi:hypothetical protein
MQQNATLRRYVSCILFPHQQQSSKLQATGNCAPLVHKSAKLNLTFLLVILGYSQPHNKAKFQQSDRKSNSFLWHESKTDIGDHGVQKAYFPFSLYIQLFSFTSTETIQLIKVFSGSTNIEFQHQLTVPERNLMYGPETLQGIVFNAEVELIYKTKPSHQQELMIFVIVQYFFVLRHKKCSAIVT